jgi:ribosomal subunit interface protein
LGVEIQIQSSMKANVQFVNAEWNATAEEIINKKLDSLKRKFDWMISADVHFKAEKEANGKGRICEVKLSLPGPQIHASCNEASFEAAAAGVAEDLEIQLKKRKSELTSH